MTWSVLTSRLDVEGLLELLSPYPGPDEIGTLVFSVPLGKWKCSLIYLEDYGIYAQWIFDNPAKSTGLELRVTTEDIAGGDLAAAITQVTGKKVVY